MEKWSAMTLLELTVILLLAYVSQDSGVTAQDYIVDSNNNITDDVTCCYIQSQCNHCRFTYKVNSITYCCPNCAGYPLVTDLVCRCYATQYIDPTTLNCTLSNTVVGNYIPWRPSYYTSPAPQPGSSVATLAMLLTGYVVLILRR